MGVVGGVSRDPLGNVPSHVKEAGNTLKMPGYSEVAGLRPIERVVRADRDFVFGIRRIVDVRYETPGYKTRICNLTFQFSPRAGENYEIIYFEDATTCGAKVVNLSLASNGTIQRMIEPTFRLTDQKCKGTEAY
jgi:hypothetical protein